MIDNCNSSFSKYLFATNFFEFNMVKDYNSKKMKQITDKEVSFLKKYIDDKNSNILDIMCGYGRLANEMYDFGYKKINGIDLHNFEFIGEIKKFKFFNENFFNWSSNEKYKYCYSLYNSYGNLEDFLKVINRSSSIVENGGLLIIDIFNKKWRDSLSRCTYRIIYENAIEKVELFRFYDGVIEKSVYIFSCGGKTRQFSYSQCVVSKEQLYKSIPNDWDVYITDSSVENTRDDDQKNILILRKKVKK